MRAFYNNEELFKPDRQPDVVLGLWQFFFDEMLQYHSSEEKCYRLRLNKYNDGFLWWSDRDHAWFSYGEDAETVYSAYLEFAIEKVLLT
jgi:hypothetical protein